MLVSPSKCSSESQLIRGTGASVGPRVSRVVFGRPTLVQVLDQQARGRPDHDWFVFDAIDSPSVRRSSTHVVPLVPRRHRPWVAHA